MKVIVEQGDLLDALMALIKEEDTDSAAEILRKLVKESLPVGCETQPTFGSMLERIADGVHKRNEAQAVAQTDGARGHGQTALPTEPESPLELRCNELRDAHGPVFVIEPKNPVEVGQSVKWGKPGQEKTVEMIEKAELPDREGKVVTGRWFAKLIDV